MAKARCLMLETARKAGHVPLGTFDIPFSRLDDVQRIEQPPRVRQD